jgi:imidazolonepropionase-like amidohydrolase
VILMEKTVKKAIKTGYGLGLLTLVKAKKVAGKVKRELKLDDKESLKLAKELVKNSGKVSKEVMRTTMHHFENALKKSGVVSKREVKIVKKQVKKKVNVAKKIVKKAVNKAAKRRKKK